MTDLTDLLDEAIEDERRAAKMARNLQPCACISEVYRKPDGPSWRCKCSTCGRVWYVTRRGNLGVEGGSSGG